MKRFGKITVSAIVFVLVLGALYLGQCPVAETTAGTGYYPGIGNTLPFDSMTYTLSDYTKVYYNLKRSDGKVVTAADGVLSATVTWVNAAIDCTADSDFKTYDTTLPSGMTEGGNFLIRWWGSTDATADNADTLLGIGYVPITVVGGSPAFADIPQSY